MPAEAAASVNKPNELVQPVNKTAHAFDKGQLDAMLLRRFFFAPAFEIYGGAYWVRAGYSSTAVLRPSWS
jgi:glycyl-tRNA synthetase